MSGKENTEEQLTKMIKRYPHLKDEISKPKDSVFTILAKNFYDENAISDYLAYILDPELNGVGAQPLNNVFETLKSPIEVTETSEVYIEREYILPNNRRIDFLITINQEIIIAIEHKVFSGEHGGQTVDYEREIKKLFSESDYDITFVFLTPHGRKPSNDSFVTLSYGELVTALKNVVVNFIGDIRKAILFNEIIFHLEEYFLSNKSVGLSDKTSLYIENHSMIQDLSNHFSNDHHHVFVFVKSFIQDYFENLQGEWHFNVKNDRYLQIFKPSWKMEELNIHFELSLRRKNLIDGYLSFMLDIEGNRKKDFKAYHETYLEEKLRGEIQRKDIRYRDGERADTFAVKDYYVLTLECLNNESLFEKNLIDLIQEFEFFINPVDEEVERFHSNREK